MVNHLLLDKQYYIAINKAIMKHLNSIAKYEKISGTYNVFKEKMKESSLNNGYLQVNKS